MRHRPLLPAAIAYLGGILLEPSLILPPLLGCALSGCVLILALRFPDRRKLHTALLLLSLTCSGAASASAVSRMFPSPHLREWLRGGWVPPEGRVPLRGRVYRPLEKTWNGFRLYLDLEWIGREHREVQGRVRLTVPFPPGGGGPPPPLVGDTVQVPARLYPIRNFRNPGGFDYVSHMAARGIFLQGSVKSSLLMERAPGGGFPLNHFLDRLRRWCEKNLESGFSDAPGVLGLLKAVLLGLRGQIPPRQEKLLQESGLYHLVAISGMHIGLWIWAWWSLLVRLRVPERPISLLTLPLLVGLLAWYGPRSSVLRAVLMAVPFLLGRFLFRRADPWNCLAFSCLGSLLADPRMARDVGFHLSYAATAGILLLGPRLLACRGGCGFPVRMLGVSVAAQAGTFPLIAYHFFRFSPIGVLLNLLAVPAMAGLLFTGLLWIPVAAASPTAGDGIAWLMKRASQWVFWVVDLIVDLPFASWRVALPRSGFLLIYYGLLLSGMVLPFPRRFRRILHAACLGSICLVVGCPSPPHPFRGVRWTVLDVGQGDSILLELQGRHRMLVDGGGTLGPRFDLGENVVSPALWFRGIRSIDVVVLTHPHRDHAGGLDAVLDNFPVGEFWTGAGQTGPVEAHLREKAVEKGIRIRTVRRGDTFHLGGCRVEVLHPGPEPSPGMVWQGNNASVVLRVSCGQVSTLLAGDIETLGERAILRGVGEVHSALLKVAHHGSSDSSSAAFLEAVRPRVALVSVGGGNRWGHPSSQVLERLREGRVAVFSTATKGAISVETDGCAVRISTQASGEEVFLPCAPRRFPGEVGFPSPSRDLDRVRNEGNQEHSQARPGEKDPTWTQRQTLLHNRWVAPTEEEQEDRP